MREHENGLPVLRRGWLFAPGVFLSVLLMKTGRPGNQLGFLEKQKAVRGFIPGQLFTGSGGVSGGVSGGISGGKTHFFTPFLNRG
ncbi:MAG: hypothetical protein KBA18_11495 [Kiritimatiellae bacterium]|nr:hypothetical protein [Kiritimatiellia bacterium]NLF99087.1 hypothetical protein [Lentisphaerota bacterium]